MSPNAPAVGPTFGTKEVMAQGLSVEVIDLITGVVDMDRGLFRPCCKEQALNLVSALHNDRSLNVNPHGDQYTPGRDRYG